MPPADAPGSTRVRRSMTAQQRTDLDVAARAFIDRIIRINKEHDMGGDLSEETYHAAVAGSITAVLPLAAD